jgi:hypothetical protein
MKEFFRQVFEMLGLRLIWVKKNSLGFYKIQQTGPDRRRGFGITMYDKTLEFTRRVKW